MPPKQNVTKDSDSTSSTSSTQKPPSKPAEKETMGDFDSTNGTDEGDINTKLSSIKLTFDETANVEFFFNQL